MNGRVEHLVLGALHSAAFEHAVALAERVRHPSEGSLTVLMYHRIAAPGERPDLDAALISATPGAFAAQMERVAATGRVIDLAQLIDALNGQRRLPAGAILVTFDDAYEDFARHAWPVLRERAVPAALFVPTAYPDHPERCFWWDRVHQALRTTSLESIPYSPAGLEAGLRPREAMGQLRRALSALPHDRALVEVDRLVETLGGEPSRGAVLGWAALRQLAGEGVMLAPHSQTHPLLDRVPAAVAEREVRGSLTDLEREIGSTPKAFAYPAGAYTASVVTTLRTAGFQAAFTTHRGANALERSDRLLLRRVNVGRLTNVAVLRARLLAPPR